MTIFRISVRILASLTLTFLALPFVWELTTGDYFMTVTGESMKPTYEIGDVLVVQKPTGQELAKVGNIVIVAFTPGDKETQYVHRVIETTDEGAILQGDNNDTPDPNPVTGDLVMGSPRLALTDGAGTAYLLTQSPWVRFPIAALAVLGLVLPLGARDKKDPRRHRAGWQPSDATPRAEAGAAPLPSAVMRSRH